MGRQGVCLSDEFGTIVIECDAMEEDSIKETAENVPYEPEKIPQTFG